VDLDLVRVGREEVEQASEQKVEESFNLWKETFQLTWLNISGACKISSTFFGSLA